MTQYFSSVIPFIASEVAAFIIADIEKRWKAPDPTDVGQHAPEVSRSLLEIPLAQDLEHELEAVMQAYVSHQYARLSRIHTLLYKVEPEPLADLCVEPILKQVEGWQTYTTEGILKSLIKKQKFLVTASAGMGKSVFLKNLFVSIVDTGVLCLPIFIEFRQVNLMSGAAGMREIIYRNLLAYNGKISPDHVDALLSSGRVVLLLDAFDEINERKALLLEANLAEFFGVNRDCGAVVTSRPMSHLQRSLRLINLNLCPLELREAGELISRLKFDPIKKENFTEKLETEYYARHKEFCSNPLLLTLMFLTYSQVGEIPSRMAAFYDQAFDTLFNKHDATKDVYVWEIKSGLDLYDFKQVFSAFCFRTYLGRRLIFTEAEVLAEIKGAGKLVHININAKQYLDDLKKRVCLIVEEGDTLEFAHRSFQEYFCASYLAKAEGLPRTKIIDNFALHRTADQVVEFLRFLNKRLVEYDWFRERLLSVIYTKSSKNVLEDISVKQGKFPIPKSVAQEVSLRKYFAPHIFMKTGHNVYFAAPLGRFTADQHHSWCCVSAKCEPSAQIFTHWAIRLFGEAVSRELNKLDCTAVARSSVKELLYSDFKVLAGFPISLGPEEMENVMRDVDMVIMNAFHAIIAELSDEQKDIEDSLRMIDELLSGKL